jgi:exopolyphosphatase/pppGpp-phosphohydrolase
MGRAIDMEKDLAFLKKELSQLKTAFSGLSATVETLQDTAPAKKHIDLHKVTTKKVTKKETKKVVEEAEA